MTVVVVRFKHAVYRRLGLDETTDQLRAARYSSFASLVYLILPQILAANGVCG